MTAYPSILIDGITTIATHNGVHRITFFKLTNDQKPEPICELMVPSSAIKGIIATFGRLA